MTVFGFLNQLSEAELVAATEYLAQLQGGTSGAGSSSDAWQQTEEESFVLPCGRIQCRWQWMVTTLLVDSDLQRVEAWADSQIAKHQIGEVRAWMSSAEAATGSEKDRFLVGLRAACQAYDLVRAKASEPNSLASAFDVKTGARKSVKALACSLRDAVVKRGVCAQGGFSSEDQFVEAIDPGFDGGLRDDDELKSQLLNSYHHIMRSSADYFRSKCSKKKRRPRKGKKNVNGQATSSLWTSGGMNRVAQPFQPDFQPYFWPFQPVYDATYAWQHALYESSAPDAGYQAAFPDTDFSADYSDYSGFYQRDAPWGGLPMPMQVEPLLSDDEGEELDAQIDKPGPPSGHTVLTITTSASSFSSSPNTSTAEAAAAASISVSITQRGSVRWAVLGKRKRWESECETQKRFFLMG